MLNKFLAWDELQQSKKLTVSLRIPKFKMSTLSDLNDAIIELGMESMFNPMRADFSGITMKEITIGGISQAVTFSMDETGVVVKSITGGKGIMGSNLEDGGNLYFDRPFLFAITENSSGAILFMGKIGKL